MNENISKRRKGWSKWDPDPPDWFHLPEAAPPFFLAACFFLAPQLSSHSLMTGPAKSIPKATMFAITAASFLPQVTIFFACN